MGKVLGNANDDVLVLAGLKEKDDVQFIQRQYPDLKTEKQQEAAESIILSIGRNTKLQDHDYDDLVKQVEMFLDFAEKKRNTQKPPV